MCKLIDFCSPQKIKGQTAEVISLGMLAVLKSEVQGCLSPIDFDML